MVQPTRNDPRVVPPSEATVLIARTLAHEVTNTFAGIMGLAQLMTRGLDVGTPLHRKADQIRAAALRASVLPGQVSALLVGGAPEAFDLTVVLGNTLPLLRQIAGPTISIEGGTSATPCWGLARMDRVVSCLVLLGLAGRRALPEGGELRPMTDNSKSIPTLRVVFAGERLLKPIEAPREGNAGADLLSDALRAVAAENPGELTQVQHGPNEVSVDITFKPAAPRAPPGSE